ncbi:MAG: YggT family protein [Alphaproteobacteria bacterium]|nr:YggT family protein [Alphaproteobacteria bacterium]
MNPFIWLVIELISLYRYVVIASVILSWLVAFNIINYGNPLVRQIAHAVSALTDPLLDPIRKVVPAFGGLDFSPIILFIALQFVEQFIWYYLVR